MASAPFFSVIIPCFNSGKFIEATIASLSAQTFRNFEVVIVDDGSSDDTLDKCSRYFSTHDIKGQIVPRPATVKKGVASCRNLGVEVCNGEWVCFLDADDLFFPEKLETIHSKIQSYGQISQAYYHAVEHFENETNVKIPLQLKERDECPVDILSELLESNFITTSSVTIKKDLFLELGGFNNELHGVEDYFMWLRVSKKTRWCYSNHALTNYRIMSNSLMRGRELTYYVSQSDALLSCANSSNEFSPIELGKIDQYMFRDLMFFYSRNSLKRKGRKDFFNGMLALMRIGKVSLSSAIMLRQLKLACLRYASTMFKKSKVIHDGVSR